MLLLTHGILWTRQDTAKDINIEDHIDTSIYEEALAQCIEKYGDEDPEFWNGLKTFFDEHN